MPAWVPSILLTLLVTTQAMAADHVILARNGPGGPNFSPSTLTVVVGDTVTFMNDPAGPGHHNVVSDPDAMQSFRCAHGCDNDGNGGDGTPASDEWSATVTFGTIGNSPFHCEVHSASMRGMIHVINSAPVLSLAPSALSVTLKQGFTTDVEFGIANSGAEDLTWTASPNALNSEDEPCEVQVAVPWLSVAPDSGTTSTDSVATVSTHFDATALEVGAYQAGICIRSNDPANSVATVVTTINVVPADRIFSDGYDG